MLEIVVVLLFPLALVYAAVRDLTSYVIPNWISLAILADFFVGAAVGSLEMSAIGWHLSAGLAVLIVGILLYARGILGGGDAKLLAACAVWVGWAGLLQFGLLVAVSGGLLALVIIGLRRVGHHPSLSDTAWVRRLASAEHGVPYAVAIGVGGIVMFKDLPLVVAFAGRVLEPWTTLMTVASL